VTPLKKKPHLLLLAALAWPTAAELTAPATTVFSFDDVTIPSRYHLARRLPRLNFQPAPNHKTDNAP